MNPKCLKCIPESPADTNKPRNLCATCDKPEISQAELKDSRDLESTGVQIWEKKKL